jgi:hypothetical protein
LIVWDFSKQPGETIQLDRYSYWGKLAALLLGN